MVVQSKGRKEHFLFYSLRAQEGTESSTGGSLTLRGEQEPRAAQVGAESPQAKCT